MKKRTATFLAVLLCFLTLSGCVTFPSAPTAQPTDAPAQPTFKNYFSASETSPPAQDSEEPAQSSATAVPDKPPEATDRKSTRLNSSHT